MDSKEFTGLLKITYDTDVMKMALNPTTQEKRPIRDVSQTSYLS